MLLLLHANMHLWAEMQSSVLDASAVEQVYCNVTAACVVLLLLAQGIAG